MKRPRWQLVAAWVAIGLLGAALRLVLLDRLPPGLNYDEGFNDLMALRLYHGAPPPIYWQVEFGEEPLHIFLISLLFRLIGPTPLGGRLISALAGSLTVLTLAFTVRELFYSELGEGRATALGLLAALSLAVLYWHVHYSRIGMEPPMVPTLAVPAFGLTWRALRTRRWETAVAAGLFLGGTLYTYPASRFVPLVLALFFGSWSLFRWRFWRENWRSFVLVAGVALVVFAPLGYFFATHPEWFFRRADMVAMKNWPGLWRELTHLLGAFFIRGDMNPRHNLPYRPILDPVQGVLFVIGLLACLVRRRPPFLFVLCWLSIMLLPSALSNYAPHFGRMLGAAPAVATLMGLGAATFYDLMTTAVAHQRMPGRRYAALAAMVILAGAYALSGLRTVRDYFVVWSHVSDLFVAFDVRLRWVGEYIAALPRDERAFFTPVGADHPTVMFFLDDHLERVQSFNGRRCFVYDPQPEQPMHHLIIVTDTEDPHSLAKVQATFPTGQIVATLPWNGAPYLVAYRTPAGSVAQTGPSHPLELHFSNGVQLIGYDEPESPGQPGTLLKFRLYWQSTEPLTQVYKTFVHLWGTPPPTEGGRIWGQEDAQPCDNSYPYAWWVPGDIVVEERWIQVPPETPPGEYHLVVGMYQDNQPRLPITDAAGRSLGDFWILTPVTIAPAP